MTVGTLRADLAQALEELEQAFPGRVTAEGSDESGDLVRIREVELSERWSPRVGDLWFVIPHQYPDAAVYPYHVVGATPTGGLIPALQAVTWRGMSAVQVSLRHTAWDPLRDNVVGCVLQTQAWLRNT